MSHIPYEVVKDILLRLPISSLLRFRCVFKAWRDTISDDSSFRRELRLNRHQHPGLLIVPRIKFPRKDSKSGYDTGFFTAAGLYRWEETHGAVTLMHHMESLPSGEAVHGFAHCDGLVMVVTESTAQVLNPATRHVLTTPPWTAPCQWNNCIAAFGLGRDPLTGAYKIVRLLQRIEYKIDGSFVHTPCVEMFTIGSDQHWRQIGVERPHIAMALQTVTFFKGSLLWNISRHDKAGPTNGFIQLRLDGEVFSVIPPPPKLWEDDFPTLSELCGELCAGCTRKEAVRAIDLWMCADMDSAGPNLPQWENRCTIHWDWPHTSLRPVVMLDDVVLICQASRTRLFCCVLQSRKHVDVKEIFHMKNMAYYNLEDVTLLEFPRGSTSYFDVIPYVPSSVSI